MIGVDAVYGTQASDVLRGRDFWDYEEFRGYGGNDLIDGRGGTDGVNYATQRRAGIVVDLAAGTVTSTDPEIGTDTLREIELVTGTNFADTYDATGYGGSSVNKNSFGEDYNLYNPLAGNDTVIGNGGTILNYANSLGGAITINLSALTNGTVSANIVTAFTDDREQHRRHHARDHHRLGHRAGARRRLRRHADRRRADQHQRRWRP